MLLHRSFQRIKRSELLKRQDGHVFAPGNLPIHNKIQAIHKPVFRSETVGGPKRSMLT